MPKINVYLPDDLAEAVKAAGVPVSAVCQRALEQAVRRVTAIRQTVLADLDLDEPTGAPGTPTRSRKTAPPPAPPPPPRTRWRARPGASAESPPTRWSSPSPRR